MEKARGVIILHLSSFCLSTLAWGRKPKRNGAYPFPSRQAMRVRPLRLYSQYRKPQKERKPNHETQTPRTHGGGEEERRVRGSRRKISEPRAALEMVAFQLPSTPLHASRSVIHSFARAMDEFGRNSGTNILDRISSAVPRANLMWQCDCLN